MFDAIRAADDHLQVTRRYFLQCGAAGVAALQLSPLLAREAAAPPATPNVLKEAIDKLEYLTPPADFGTVERGNPIPYTLPEEKRREAGLERETWRLEVLADPASNTKLEKPLSIEAGTAFNWAALMKLAETKAVRFLKVMTCNNGDTPLGMGLWEGVPLREVVWLTQPHDNLRRIFYHGYHNDDPKQLFESSLPVGRVLEDPPGEHPVILCYKLNGEWISGKRGGPVRMLVPDAYGFKSVKWLQKVLLTNEPFANDTYAKGNNDVDSWMKTFARVLSRPAKVKPGQPVPVTGVAQVGISGLTKVQYWLNPQETPLPANDPYFTTAPWVDARILPPPEKWGGGLAEGIPAGTEDFDANGRPVSWPLRYTIVHWAALLTDLAPGKYDLRCRTIDARGVCQPLPRPFAKSGHSMIRELPLTVAAD